MAVSHPLLSTILFVVVGLAVLRAVLSKGLESHDLRAQDLRWLTCPLRSASSSTSPSTFALGVGFALAIAINFTHDKDSADQYMYDMLAPKAKSK
jgi:hypothetical protein